MENDRVEKEKKGGSFGFFSEPLFYLCVATLFFYLCAEQGVIGWMITYFKDTGFLPASLSQMTASVLWVMILAGRLTTAWLSHQNAKRKTAADHGRRTCMLFLFTVIQPQYRMDRDRYHGFRLQHGGNLSDDGFLCRKSH